MKTIDEIEVALQELEDPGLKWRHFFYPGTYCREMWVPAGAVVTSKIHKTEHQFVLSAGALIVRTDNDEIFLEAPYLGITKPGTRRVAYFPVDSVWTTIHKIPWITGEETESDLERIEDELIEKYQNPLLEGEFKNKIQCHSQQPQDLL